LIQFIRPGAQSKAAQPDKEDTSHYYALVLRGQKEPRLIDLGMAEELDLLVALYHQALAVGAEEHPKVKQLGAVIYQLLLDPLREELKEVKKLVIAPEGALALLPFALLPHENRFLGDQYQIRYVNSMKDLWRWELMKRQVFREVRPPLIVGEPDYDAFPAGVALGAAARKTEGALALLRNAQWSKLAGARAEAEAIRDLWKASNPRLLLGSNATETAVRTYTRPKFVHISTHGYFLPDLPFKVAFEEGKGYSIDFAEPDKDDETNNPFLRSGLALTGAAKWSQIPDAAQDGLLTALDVSLWDLEGTELAILSACSTGLGDVRSSEGVVGLRQAFLAAGARALIVSLWPVPDAETKDLMTRLHYHLLRGKKPALALDLAAKELREDLKKKDKTPAAFWGGFICVGDPE
jgi:CHAT domain-containing protein